MPDRSLHRLESYQSGGSVSGGGEVGDGDIDIVVNDHNDASASVGGTEERSNGGIVPRLFTQFSLIGDTDVNDDGEEVMTETSYRFGTHRSRRWRRWLMTNFWRTAIVLLMLCFTLFAVTKIRVGKTARKKDHGKASPSITSKTTTSEHKTCPIRQSYLVSSEIMGLKNTSTGEWSCFLEFAFSIHYGCILNLLMNEFLQ